MKKIFVFCVLLFLFGSSVWASSDIPLTAQDHPDDDGSAIDLSWKYEGELPFSIWIERSENGKDFKLISKIAPAKTYITDGKNIKPGNQYYYRLKFVDAQSNIMASTDIVKAKSEAQWFNSRRTPLLVMVIILSSAILYFILSARKGKHLFIRKIAGLDTIEEAVGRATELGKPLLFVPGIMDLDNIQTLAGLNILSHLAKKVAKYDSTLYVPVSKSMVLSTAKEIVKEAYLKVGRPDAFDSDSVFYLTDDQFGYVAGVDGIIVREKPAATFYLGAFYAESLILAETGFESGAIQIAGTAMPSQIPFFVAACDYTLIGEELFAASAYLSDQPNQLGCLKGQDVGKALILITIFVGIILDILGINIITNFLQMK